VKNLGGEILVTVRSPEGSWTDWAAVPGGGMTDVPVCALRADPTGSNAGTDPSHGDTDQLHDQLYLFSKGIGDRAPYLDIASETGTWSQWQPIHSGGTTDVAFAAAAIRDKLYQAGKEVLVPYPADAIRAWPISPRVNSPEERRSGSSRFLHDRALMAMMTFQWGSAGR
jgi:hypothetical protein